MALSVRLAGSFDAVLLRTPAQPLFRWLASQRLVVLAYHEVPDADAFAWQVDYLRKYTHPVSLSEVIAAIGSRRSLPRRSVLITFDDGDRSVYEQALPVLHDKDVPAVIFVIAGLIGTDAPFWWCEVEQLVRRGGTVPGLPVPAAACVAALKRVPDGDRRGYIEQLRASVAGARVTMRQLQPSEVATLEDAGITIGNHTFTHPCLNRCSDATLRTELVRAHETLVKILGRAPTAFAYPNGNADSRVPPILAELGYEVAFLFDHRIGPFPPRDRYRISRVRVASSMRSDRFRILVSGLHASIHQLLGRV